MKRQRRTKREIEIDREIDRVISSGVLIRLTNMNAAYKAGQAAGAAGADIRAAVLAYCEPARPAKP